MAQEPVLLKQNPCRFLYFTLHLCWIENPRRRRQAEFPFWIWFAFLYMSQTCTLADVTINQSEADGIKPVSSLPWRPRLYIVQSMLNTYPSFFLLCPSLYLQAFNSILPHAEYFLIQVTQKRWQITSWLHLINNYKVIERVIGSAVTVNTAQDTGILSYYSPE